MKYQVLSITLDKGNAVFLPHAFELAADSLGEVGAKIEENFAELGLKVKGVRALHKSDVTEDWQREPEKPNLFNKNGKDEDALPKKRGPKPKKALAIADMREKRT
jgi:hypothetical protein